MGGGGEGGWWGDKDLTVLYSSWETQRARYPPLPPSPPGRVSVSLVAEHVWQPLKRLRSQRGNLTSSFEGSRATHFLLVLKSSILN